MTDTKEHDYDYYFKALALGEKLKADREHRVPIGPQAGFYRTHDRKPVAIWYDDDGCTFMINGQTVHEDDYEEKWISVCRNPVTEDAYRTYVETGHWGDVDPAIAETLGHNIEGVEDPEEIRRMIERLTQAASQYARISDDETAKRAHSLRARIGQLRLRADKLRTAAKEPHLRAGQEIDRLWTPMVKDAQSVEKQLGASIGNWEDQKRMAIREAERKAAEAIWPKEGLGEVPLPEPREQIRSGYGRAASVKVRNVVTEIEDFDKLVHFFRYSEDLHGFLMELAQRRVDAGYTVPGVKVEERSVVR